ncbi:hypothetical protein ACLOJK_034877, partial [Asimina triloba]
VSAICCGIAPDFWGCRWVAGCGWADSVLDWSIASDGENGRRRWCDGRGYSAPAADGFVGRISWVMDLLMDREDEVEGWTWQHWQGRADMDAGSCGVGSSGIAGRRTARWVSTHLDLASWKKGQPSVVMVGCGSGWKEAGGAAAVSPLTGWPALEKKMEYWFNQGYGEDPLEAAVNGTGDGEAEETKCYVNLLNNAARFSNPLHKVEPLELALDSMA